MAPLKSGPSGREPSHQPDRGQAPAADDPDELCTVCEGCGFFTVAVPVGHPQFGLALECPACHEARVAKHQARIDARKQAL